MLQDGLNWLWDFVPSLITAALTLVVGLWIIRMINKVVHRQLGEPEIVTAGYVSSSMFAVLREPPLLGRTLIPEDDGAEPQPVFVLSYDLWQRRFGGDSVNFSRDGVDLTGELFSDSTRNLVGNSSDALAAHDGRQPAVAEGYKAHADGGARKELLRQLPVPVDELGNPGRRVRSGRDDCRPHLVLTRDPFHVEVAAMAGATEIGHEPSHRRRSDGPFEGEDLGQDAAVGGFEPIGQPPGGNIEEAVAVRQSGEVHGCIVSRFKEQMHPRIHPPW